MTYLDKTQIRERKIYKEKHQKFAQKENLNYQ